LGALYSSTLAFICQLVTQHSRQGLDPSIVAFALSLHLVAFAFTPKNTEFTSMCSHSFELANSLTSEGEVV